MSIPNEQNTSRVVLYIAQFDRRVTTGNVWRIDLECIDGDINVCKKSDSRKSDHAQVRSLKLLAKDYQRWMVTVQQLRQQPIYQTHHPIRPLSGWKFFWKALYRTMSG